MQRIAAAVTLGLATAVLAVPHSSATSASTAEKASRGTSGSVPAPDLAAGVIVKTGASSSRPSLRATVAGAAGSTVTATAVARDVTAFQTAELMPLRDAQALAADLARQPGVVWAEANALLRPDAADPGPDVAPPSAVNDPLFPQLYNLWDTRDATSPEVAAVAPNPWPAGGYSTKAPALWPATRGSSSVVLAVIDTGYRPHADLAVSLVPGFDVITSAAISADGDGPDADPSDPGDFVAAGECSPGSPSSGSSWHGTHVAGTAAAPADNLLGVAGVAPGVRIMPIRALGKCGGSIADIATGVSWAAGVSVPGLPVNPNPAKVINMSLGGSGACDATFQSAIDAARAKGATIVVSAGNDNADASSKSPASCNGVVVVGSSSEYGDKASYSNFGALVDVSAPGGDTLWDGRGILSTYNLGTTVPGGDSYEELEGTSMAAPAVAGAAALLASLAPFSPDQSEAALKAAVTAFPTSAAAGFAPCSPGYCGAGVLDLSKVPAPLTAPSIGGSARAGGTLTAAPGTWTGPAVPLAYTWLQGGAVAGTGATFEVRSRGAVTLRVGPASGAFAPVQRDSAAVAPTGKKSKIKLVAPKRIRKGVKARVGIVVKVKGTKKPKGTIMVYDGTSKVGKVTLKAKNKGRATIQLKALKKLGKHTLTALFAGKIGTFDSTSKKVKIKVVRR